MNKNLLLSIMTVFGDTGGSLANQLNMDRSTFSAKINGKSDFTQGEIVAIKKLYDLSPSQVDAIFFNA